MIRRYHHSRITCPRCTRELFLVLVIILKIAVRQADDVPARAKALTEGISNCPSLFSKLWHHLACIFCHEDLHSIVPSLGVVGHAVINQRLMYRGYEVAKRCVSRYDVNV